MRIARSSVCSTHFRAPRRGHRRSDRRRVHLRPRRARVARSAGAHSSVRLDADSARRRRQCGEQRRRARRPHADRRAHGKGRGRQAPSCEPRPRQHTRPVEPAGILHAGEDAHSRRRRAHGQTADRAHRSRRLERLRCEEPGGIHARGAEGGCRVRRDSDVGLRHRPRDAGAGRGAQSARRRPSAAPGLFPSSSIHATTC